MKAKSFLSISDFAIVGLFAMGVAAIEGLASSTKPACRSCEFDAVRRAVLEESTPGEHVPSKAPRTQEAVRDQG